MIGHLTSIPLTDEQSEAVEHLLASGACSEPGDIIAAGLASIAAREAAWFRAEVLPVIEAMERDPGRAIPAEQVFAELRALNAKHLAGA